MKKLKEEQGFTLMELIVSMAIIAIFYLILSTLLASGSKMYLQQTVMGNAEALIEGIADEMKGYVVYGKDIQVYYRITQSDKIVLGKDFTPELGSAPEARVYLIENSPMAGTNAVCELPDGEKKYVSLSNLDQFYGNAIDLGFKNIYLKKEASPHYIQGLSYGSKYYQGLQMTLRIIDEEKLDSILNPTAPDSNKKGLYTIEVAGENDTNTYTFQSSVAVGGLNEK